MFNKFVTNEMKKKELKSLFKILCDTAEQACDIPINQTKKETILYYINEKFILDDFTGRHNNLSEVLLNADKRKVNFLMKNLSKAIQTNCNNNDIDLDKIVISEGWCIGTPESIPATSNIIEKYKDYKIRPANEDEFKRMWLKIFIQDLTSIKKNADYILNIESPDESESTEIKKSNERMKPLHNQIFKDNAFEIWQRLFENLNVTESKRTDLRFMYEVMKYNGQIHNTVSVKNILDWINETYQFSIEKLQYTNFKSKSNKNRLSIYNLIK